VAERVASVVVASHITKIAYHPMGCGCGRRATLAVSRRTSGTARGVGLLLGKGGSGGGARRGGACTSIGNRASRSKNPELCGSLGRCTRAAGRVNTLTLPEISLSESCLVMWVPTDRARRS
jgi:hypothetical protein